MTKILASLFVLICVLLALGAWSVVTLRADRPPAAPPGSPIKYPWGAMHVDKNQDEPTSDLERTIVESFKSEPEGEFDQNEDGVNNYAILVLSGGGAAGAFGAGLLSGWSEHGDRPDFKIVTGVSTGSLQSTFAFLGPEYDDDLTEVFTRYGTEDIYTERSIFGALLGESAWDTEPLMKLIEKYITPEVLDAVARHHARGHRLFVGTSNMDTSEFIIWDMGAIASSDHEDKLERYRTVLLASCSIPVLFPPVYFATEIDGQKYWEMHVDGGAQSQLFLRGFMLDFEDTLEEEGFLADSEVSIYIIRNGTADEEVHRDIVGASSVSIAVATINGVFDLSTQSSLFRVYTLASRYDIDFSMAAIPDDMFPDLDPVDFDLDVMRRVYDYAFAEASKGYEWLKTPPGLDADERMAPLQPTEAR